MYLNRRTIPVFSPAELATIDDLCRKGLDYGTAHHLVAQYPDVIDYDYDRTFAEGTPPSLWALAWQVVECVWDTRYHLKLTFIDEVGQECGSTVVHNAGPNDLDGEQARQLHNQIDALAATVGTVSIERAGAVIGIPAR